MLCSCTLEVYFYYTTSTNSILVLTFLDVGDFEYCTWFCVSNVSKQSPGLTLGVGKREIHCKKWTTIKHCEKLKFSTKFK